MKIADHFTLAARLQAMLDVEGALAEAEASLGIIPQRAATAIRPACRAELYDAAALEDDARRAGNLAIPLVRELTKKVAAQDQDAARSVHWGTTSQDIIDSALVLQLRQAVPVIVGDLARAAEAAAGHARRHAKTPMAGRTWLQQATPITFGLKAAGYVDALDRATNGVRTALNGAMTIQFGGASGTLAALGEDGIALAKRLASDLRLDVPAVPWHAHRDRLASLCCVLGIATGTAGKIARDIALLSQTEVGEAHEATTDGGSSTMPQKQNPVNSAAVLSAATRAPGLVATVLAAMPQEHERALGGWQAEWDTIPELVIIAADAASGMADALERLVVDPARMRANLDASGGLVLAEAVTMRLAPHVGRHAAHSLVARAARRVSEDQLDFADALSQDPQISAILDRHAIEETLTPDRYLGATSAFIDDVLARHAKA